MEITEPLRYILIFFSGLIAAFINVMAGGGSALSVGLMVLFGVDGTIANGSNRIGVFSAGATSAWNFHKNGKLDIKGALPFALIACVGSILGAIYASKIEGALFQRILAITMIFVIATLFLPKGKEGAEAKWKKYATVPAMLLVGLYGGFIQAGVGFLIMATYKHLKNLDLVTINARKMFITLVFTAPAIVVFIVHGKIHWGYAAMLALGNGLGGILATKLALKKGDKVVKYILAVALALMAWKFWSSF